MLVLNFLMSLDLNLYNFQIDTFLNTYLSIFTFSSISLYLITLFSIINYNILIVIILLLAGWSFWMRGPTPAQIGAALGGIAAAIQTAAAGSQLYDRFGGGGNDNKDDDNKDDDNKDTKSKEESTSKTKEASNNKTGTTSTTNKG
jgi:hypothetical protein